jgi:hypothetical protein
MAVPVATRATEGDAEAVFVDAAAPSAVGATLATPDAVLTPALLAVPCAVGVTLALPAAVFVDVTAPCAAGVTLAAPAAVVAPELLTPFTRTEKTAPGWSLPVLNPPELVDVAVPVAEVDVKFLYAIVDDA